MSSGCFPTLYRHQNTHSLPQALFMCVLKKVEFLPGFFLFYVDTSTRVTQTRFSSIRLTKKRVDVDVLNAGKQDRACLPDDQFVLEILMIRDIFYQKNHVNACRPDCHVLRTNDCNTHRHVILNLLWSVLVGHTNYSGGLFFHHFELHITCFRCSH